MSGNGLSHIFFWIRERRVYICGMYIWGEDSPANNFVNVDFFDLLQTDIDIRENYGYVFLVVTGTVMLVEKRFHCI